MHNNLQSYQNIAYTLFTQALFPICMKKKKILIIFSLLIIVIINGYYTYKLSRIGILYLQLFKMFNKIIVKISKIALYINLIYKRFYRYSKYT